MKARPHEAGRPLLALAALLLRVWWLPLWGTFDIEVQKAWSARAVQGGVASIYGPDDRELLQLAEAHGGGLAGLARMAVPQHEFTWGTERYFVDYPPGSVLVLWAAGKLYELVSPDLRNRPAYNAAINFAPFLCSLAIAALLYRSRPGPEGRLRAAAFWLNPAILLAAPVLGYQDTIFGLLALAAILALQRGYLSSATALVVVAGLIKPQGVLLLPTAATVILAAGRPRDWARCALAGSAAAAVVLAPWWLDGHLLSALDGCRRPLRQGTLAPLGFGAWWIAGWAMDSLSAGTATLARIVPLQEWEAWAGWDARVVARPALLLTAAANAAVLVVSRRSNRDIDLVPLSVAVQVHLYALLGTSVHENHTLLAVIVAPLLLGADRRARAFLAATSAFLFANLYLAAGFGRRITRLRDLEELRMALGLDLSVLVAAAHVLLGTWLCAWYLRRALGPAPDANSVRTG